MEKPVIIFGAKGIAHPALEIFNSNNVVVYGVLEEDEKLHGTEINTVTVLGNTEDDGFLKLIGQKAEAFVAVDDTKYRKFLVEMLQERRKVQPVNAIHQTAYISTDAVIGHGNFINAKVNIGTAATIGSHCILHSGAIIDHPVRMDSADMASGNHSWVHRIYLHRNSVIKDIAFAFKIFPACFHTVFDDSAMQLIHVFKTLL